MHYKSRGVLVTMSIKLDGISTSFSQPNILDQIMKNYDGGAIVLDPFNDYKIVEANDYFLLLTGYSRQELIGQQLSLLNKMIYRSNLMEKQINKLLEARVTQLHYRKNGASFWHNLFMLPIKNKHEETILYLILSNDATETYNMQAIIELEREMHLMIELGEPAKKVFGHIADHISKTLKKGCECNFLLFNQPLFHRENFGNLPKEIVETIYPNHVKLRIEERLLAGELETSIILNDFSTHYFWEKHLDLLHHYEYKSVWNEAIYDKDRNIIGIFAMYFNDRINVNHVDMKYITQVASIISLTNKYFEQRAEIAKLAYFDEHSGLPNLTAFRKAVKQFSEKDALETVYIIQPSEFQHIVDVYGRKTGDRLLKKIANRIEREFAEFSPTVARFTTSSLIFTTVCKQPVKAYLMNCLAELSLEPYSIDQLRLFVTLKLGVAYKEGSAQSEEIIQQADTALSYALKESGNYVQVYKPILQQQLLQEMQVMSEVEIAIEKNEFIPLLQPKVDIQTKEIVGFEALARWNSPTLGFVSPALFIPIAEKAGSIAKIDCLIFEKVLKWIVQRKENQKKIYPVSINISPNHFYLKDFVQTIQKLIEAYEVDPQYICLEVTESIELANLTRAKEILAELKALGIQTSMDDFGIGYSSLSYIQQLEFDELKIDKSFIDDVTNKRMNTVIKSIIQIAHSMGMSSVAEGIETEEQHHALLENGCLIGQGYYYYKPMPITEIEAIIDALPVY